MAEEERSEQRTSSEAWREVGQQFEALGKSLSAAFREAWNDETTREAAKEIESGLRTMSRAVADAVDEAAGSPEGQKLRAEAERVAQSAHEVGSQAVDEARPHVVAALQSIQRGLESAIEAFQHRRGEASGEEGPGASPEGSGA